MKNELKLDAARTEEAAHLATNAKPVLALNTPPLLLLLLTGRLI